MTSTPTTQHPTVTGVTPNNGAPAGGNSVTVNGTNLTGATAVHFGSIAGTWITADTAGSLTVTVPAGTGTVDVTVTTANGTSAVNAPSDEYTYNGPPTVTGVSPNNGPQGGTNSVIVDGSDLTGATAVHFGSIAGTSISADTAGSLTVIAPAGTGTVDVTVTTANGTSAVNAPSDQYTYNPAPDGHRGHPEQRVPGRWQLRHSGRHRVRLGIDRGRLRLDRGYHGHRDQPRQPHGDRPGRDRRCLRDRDHHRWWFVHAAGRRRTPTTRPRRSPGSAPRTDQRAAGPSVTVSGTNLTGATAVDFGSIAGHRDHR